MTQAQFGEPKLILPYLIDISESTTVGPNLDLQHYKLAAIICPGTLTSTAITFTAAESDGGTYATVTDVAGTTISVTVAASKAPGLTGTSAAATAPHRFLRLIMGSAEAADRQLYLVMAQ